MQKEPLQSVPYYLSSEVCLLKLLPVKNPFFRQLERSIQAISDLRASNIQSSDWRTATKAIEYSIVELDRKRNQLEPVFNQEDSTMLQITKSVRGEQLIESFRDRLVELVAATKARNTTKTFLKEKEALLALSEVGELLVASFPFDVPTDGKFSYLPRLQGRARVVFSFRRQNKILGNVTIVADGYAGPITAGNFVDLSIRNFYTGLPIKFSKKRVGSGAEFEVANLPILGSFQEGFYDPLTAKLRRIPLEIVRNDKASGVPNLSYSQGLPNLFGSKVAMEKELTSKSNPLLSFNIPGLVAMNHPDRSPNGGSSEFFSLQKDSMLEERRGLLDSEYAPFGYIIDGYDIFQQLEAGDIIDETAVDEWGQLNLVKLRRSSFSEVVQGTEEEST
jgi:peptidylprolyl isomerase